MIRSCVRQNVATTALQKRCRVRQIVATEGAWTLDDCARFCDGVRLWQFVAFELADSISGIRISESSRVRQIVAPPERRL
jgi:hypothetical protein